MSYTPKPIDTSSVSLNADVIALTEQLAEHAHDVWAAHRFSQGWTHGPQRDDAAKRHPCLIPYDQLPEAEKEYDRKTAMETLKAIIALGYYVGKMTDMDTDT